MPEQSVNSTLSELKGKTLTGWEEFRQALVVDIEFEIGWGGFYANKTERKATEAEIFQQLEIFPKKSSASEGVEIIDEC